MKHQWKHTCKQRLVHQFQVHQTLSLKHGQNVFLFLCSINSNLLLFYKILIISRHFESKRQTNDEQNAEKGVEVQCKIPSK